MPDNAGVPIFKPYREPKKEPEKPYRQIAIGVVIIIIAMFPAYLINKYILNPVPQQPIQQLPILKTTPTHSQKSETLMPQQSTQKQSPRPLLK